MVCTYGDYASRGDATTQEPVDGCGGPQRNSERRRDLGRGQRRHRVAEWQPDMQKDQIKSVQLVDTDTRTVLLQTNL